jgi:uncharacterized repeat protein (TIGR03837 family)
MGSMQTAPVWIDLEYLSAEPYVERSHGLPSPQALGDGRSLTTWFYYPGFTAATGGLIREPGLLARRQQFDPDAWLASSVGGRRPGEQVVSLFCYEQPALPALISRLAQRPTLLLATAGPAARQVEQCLGSSMRQGALRAITVPALGQTGFDQLLWASDLNFVRGEDSFVRAQWAGRPFVWQIYPQGDGAHIRKLDAFLDLFLRDADAELASRVRHLWAAWNSALPFQLEWPERQGWAQHCTAWRDALAARADLVTRLIDFAAEKG